jgi:hypothetical protein
MTLLTPTGRYDHRGIMRKAHGEFQAAKRRGQAWSFARCLAFAWAIAREQRTRNRATSLTLFHPRQKETPPGARMR